METTVVFQYSVEEIQRWSQLDARNRKCLRAFNTTTATFSHNGRLASVATGWSGGRDCLRDYTDAAVLLDHTLVPSHSLSTAVGRTCLGEYDLPRNPRRTVPLYTLFDNNAYCLF
eukprot:m.102412 g.102412  ORF g.102412 m.102412 type:complete len:115 (-) comp20806_c0_seq3:8-352(-)